MSNQYDIQAWSIIRTALINRSITRTDFNIARRIGCLMEDTTRAAWHILNDAISHRTEIIVEDGDTIFPITLTRDASGAVVRVESASVGIAMCSPSRQHITGAHVTRVQESAPVPARIDPVYLDDDDVIVPSLFRALIEKIDLG